MRGGLSFLVTLILVLSPATCAPEDPLGPEAAGAIAPRAEAAPARATPARRETVPIWREISATVRSLDHVQASAETVGRLLAIHADVGNRVEAGQLLAEIDPSALRTECDAAASSLELARSEAERVTRLRDQSIAPQQEWDRAQTVLRQAEAQLRLAEIALAKTRILAPVAAVVEARLVGPGDLAVPGTPLFRLYDPDRVCLEAQLPVGDREYAALGVELTWSLGVAAGQSRVSEVAPSSDPRSRTVRIRVPLDPGLRIQGEAPAPGDFGVLRYRVGEREQIVVPAAALFRVGQVEMVRVREERGWVRRAVRSGARRGELIEILSGLAGGEEVGLP